MDIVFNSLLARASLGAGLSGLSGIRAFLPLGLLSLVGRAGGFDVVRLEGTSFDFLRNWWLIILLLALGAGEIVLDKVPQAAPFQRRVAAPLRILMGALVFGACMAVHGTAATIIGVVAGAVLAGLAYGVSNSMQPGLALGATGAINPYASFFEDIVVAVLCVVLFVLPVVGILVVLFLVYLGYRIDRRRRRKYKGLRILRG